MLFNATEAFKENLALVYSVIRKYDINNQDLFQAGCIGLYQACQRYDEKRGKLSTFAIPYIKEYVILELKKTKIRLSKALFPIINYIKKNEKYDIEELMIKFHASRKTVISALYFKAIDVFDETKYMYEEKEINDYLDDLSDKEKAIILLYFKKKFRKKEIADILHISLNQLNNFLKEALLKIEKSIVS